MRIWIAALATAVAVTATTAGAQARGVAGLASDIARHHSWLPAAGDQGNLPYNGGPVLHANRTHVIFWQPSGSGLTFDPGYQQLIEQFLDNVAADSHDPSNVYGLTGQYTDDFGSAAYASTWGGGVLATDRLPGNGCVEPPVTGPGWTVCLTNSQLQAEIEHVVRTDHLPTTEEDVYFLVTPKGLGSCTDSTSKSCALGGSTNGYCGYHSETPDGAVIYGVIPYNAVPGHCQSDNPRPNSNTADPTISTISHEHSEMVTDPAGDAWIDSSGSENGDLCITTFGPPIGGSGQAAYNQDIHGGHYFLQDEWSNEDHACEPRDEPAGVTFAASSARKGAVRLAARAHDPDGRIVGYLWQFGDGGGARGRAVRHTFRHLGSFKVTLRITDSSSNWTYYTRAISVSTAPDRRRRRRARSRSRTKSG